MLHPYRMELTFICTTLTLQIKEMHGATNLMYLFASGQHHDVALVGQHCDVALEGDIPFL